MNLFKLYFLLLFKDLCGATFSIENISPFFIPALLHLFKMEHLLVIWLTVKIDLVKIPLKSIVLKTEIILFLKMSYFT